MDMFLKTEDIKNREKKHLIYKGKNNLRNSRFLIRNQRLKWHSMSNAERILSQKSAAAAKSLQSCPTLCDPIDSSQPGSPVPGILQARTLEWVSPEV